MQELGYILGKKFWGGFMTEAVIAVLDFLLNKVGFKEIKSHLCQFKSCYQGKSWKKAGMQYVETIPHAIQRKGYCGDKIIILIKTESLSIG